MKVLLIGQLPKEIGGNYTTGAANVVYELSKQREAGVLYYTYGTNITDSAATKASSFLYQYIGYKFRPFRMVLAVLCHPLDTFRHMMYYHTVDHQCILRFVFYEANIREAIKRVQPDLIHVNSITNVSPVRFAIGKSKIPMLLTCHGIFYRGDEKDVVNRDRNLGNIKLADAYSGLTKASLNEYESILGIPKNRVAVIPNGVDCKKFYYSPEERVNIRKEFDVKDACKVFITVASVQERKGQLVFLKMLSMLDIDFRYWIVGKGSDEEAILQYVEENGLQGKVRMLGYKTANELYKYYSAADIYAHPSLKEGQALAEIEAYSTGLRIVVNSKIADTVIGDAFIDKQNYYIMDFDNVDYIGFTQWVEMETLERFSRNHFDWSKIARKYGELYHAIVEKRTK